MKTLTFTFTLAIIITAASTVSFGQKREITKEIYDTDVRAAYQKARTFLPRRVSNFDFDGKLRSYFEYDTAGSFRYVSLPDARYGGKGTEYLVVGDSGYKKQGDGAWVCTDSAMAFGVSSLPGSRSYYVEPVTLSGKTFTAYTEANTEYPDSKSDILVDDLGRMASKRESYGSEEKFEYDVELETIVAPNVKCFPKQK